MSKKQVSVVVPTYNETLNLRPLTERLFKATRAAALDVDLLFADDESVGSVESAAIVAALRSEVEATYAQLFTEGHLSAARAALRDGAGDYALRRPSRGADTFVAGALVGVAACASASLLVARQHLESPVETLDDVGWAFVRLASLPALHVLGFAVDILAWQETSVNWVNVFAMLPARAAETLEWPFLARMTSGVLASALVALR